MERCKIDQNIPLTKFVMAFCASVSKPTTKLFDKRYDFNFPIVNFPFICSNIPAAPAYGVYMSQLIRYSRALVPVRISLIEGCC